MDEQLNEQVKSEESSGIGASGVIGGIGGGAAAAYGSNRYLANKGIKAVLEGSKEAKEPFTKLVTDTLAKTENAELASKANGIKESAAQLKEFAKADTKTITKVLFTEDTATKGVFNMHVTKDGATTAVNVAKLPSGVKVGEEVAADKIAGLFEGEKSFVKTAAAKLESELANGIRKVSGFAAGFKNVSGGGKAAIIGATVAGVAAGSYVVHSMFGGKHSDQVAAERSAPAQSTGRV